MTQNEIMDPFKPAQPRIPGVLAPSDKKQEDTRHLEGGDQTTYEPASGATHPEKKVSRTKIWMGILVVGGIATVALLFGSSPKSASVTQSGLGSVGEPSSASKYSPDLAGSATLGEKLRTGPGEVATTAELAKPWAAKRFIFRDPTTSKTVPAIVVHLPGGMFWGFSLVEPYGSCELEYVTDLNKLKAEYDYKASYPMVVDPCNKTVFDLTRYGNAPGGLVRGEIQQGSGWRPPMAIEVHTKGTAVVALRME